jgi:hypothetical protein
VIGRVKICWHDDAAGRSAADVFDYFQLADLATHRSRHHCLAALQRDNSVAIASG